MNFLKTKKNIALAVSAALLGSAIIGGISGSYRARAITDTEKSVISATEAEINAEEVKSEKNSNVKDEDTENIQKNTVVLWKAELSDYRTDFSLVSYEKVESEDVEEPSEDNSDEKIDLSLEYTNSATMLDVPEREYCESADISSGNFGITTYGYGHGLGMSQNGANYYATYSGWGYQTILAHYYPGTYIQNTGTAQSETISAGGVSGSALDIVSMVVYNEVSDSMNVEAIKAQAVAAYSYIKYKGGNAYDLYPRSNPPETVVNAVRQVLGEAIYYDGEIALAMFNASSGGATASCYDIYYEDIPYLRSVPSEYDAQCDPHYGTVAAFSANEVRNALEGNLGITLSDDPNNWIQIVEGDGGYVASVIIDGQVTIKGSDFKYYLGLKSPKFTCQYYN